MTLEERANKIKEAQEKNNLIVSPRVIQGGARLIYDRESLDMYESMEDNTTRFAENEIVNIIAEAKKEDNQVTKNIKFTIVFEGDFDDLPKDNISYTDFIQNYSNRMVAVQRFVKSERTEHFFVGFAQSETHYDYGFIYLRLSQLLELFKENGISFDINMNADRDYPSITRDDTITYLTISYLPQKEKNDGIARTYKDNSK